MVESYDVYLGGEAIGKVYVDVQGLYYRFRCRCRFSGTVIYKLLAERGGASENLGIPVPAGGEFVLDTKLPVKRFPDGEFRFYVLPKHQDLVEKFVPLSPQEPFAYIAQLKNAYLQKRDGQVGIVIREG